jgi:protease-4
MKQFLITVAGVFAGLLLFFVGLPILVVSMLIAGARPGPAPADTVLTLDLREPLTDQEPNTPFAFLGGRSLSAVGVVQTLNRAAHDPAVKGLLVRLPESGIAPGEADEVRQALDAFRATGKPSIAFSQGVYASGFAPATYMLGAAAGQFWMQPGASLQVTGVGSEELFYKRFFDKYGLSADYQQREQYKTAVNPLLYDDYTAAHRESQTSWMTSIYDSEIAAAAADRKTDPAALKTTLEAGPYGADAALAHRLIDRTGELSDAVEALKGEAGDGARLMTLAAYRNTRRTHPAVATGPSIALIGAEGDIVTGTANSQGLTDAKSAVYSDDVAKAFQDAIEDADVKAIVFRVSSPGGSDTASEQIAAAVRQAVAARKPVVVSMGTYAASGGYWISSGASEIVAEPTTLTGSIGVFGGKLVIGPALARFGLDLRDLDVVGGFAGAYGSAQPFTPAQRAALSAWMDRIYQEFIGRVATGRHLPVAKVADIAKGRVWTGAQAKSLGLVDKLGGLSLATADARRLAGLAPDEGVTLKMVPGRRSPFEVLDKSLGLGARSLSAVATAAWLLGDPRSQAAIDALARERLQSSGQGAVLAPVGVR